MMADDTQVADRKKKGKDDRARKNRGMREKKRLGRPKGKPISPEGNLEKHCHKAMGEVAQSSSI